MNTFPLEFSKHIVFCLIGGGFFLFQYFRQGFKYQLMSAIAICMTLLLYINDSIIWRYIVGIAEAVMIAAILITMSVERKKEAAAKEEAEKAASENTEKGENAVGEAAAEKVSADNGETENE